MENSKNFTTSLSWQMFGKQKKDLTLDELREYNRERKRQSRKSDAVRQSDAKYMRKWREKNREYRAKYMREWRAKKKCQQKTD